MNDVSLPAPLVDRLDHWFDDVEVKAPAVGYAVYDRTGVLFHRGLGTSATAPGAVVEGIEVSARASLPPGPDTLSRICSMSKSFLIAGLLVLVERGLVDLDAPVSRYVPEFRDPVVLGEVVPVTVRMLCTNSSGLPEDNAWADHHLGMSREDVRALIAQGLRFSDIPGARYQYSNVGFGLVGIVLEAVAGERFESFITRELIEPLGLTMTKYDWSEYPSGTDMMLGFTSFDDGTSWIHRPFVETGILGSAGSLYSTATDIARWVSWLSAAFARPADEAGPPLLSAASRRLMQRLQTPIHSMSGRMVRGGDYDAVGYGLGLVVEMNTRYGAIAQHSGGLPGFSTNMRWHCESGIGTVVFVNSNGMPAAEWAAELLADVLDALDLPAREVDLWPETVRAAESIDRIATSGGSFADLAGIASANLFSDVPPEIRDEKFRGLLDDVGGIARDVPPLSDRALWCVSAADLVWRIPGNTGDLQARIEMAEVAGTPLQRLVIEKFGAETASIPADRDLVVTHFRPHL